MKSILVLIISPLIIIVAFAIAFYICFGYLASAFNALYRLFLSWIKKSSKQVIINEDETERMHWVNNSRI